jgi:adenosine deaminase
VIAAAKPRLDAAEARRRELLKCDTRDADPGCEVTIRYVAQVSRAAAAQVVFAQMVGWFELIAADPRIVALNLVQPEDDPVAIRDFALQMSMLDFLHQHYPAVPIALHAGELAEGMVPPHALRSHVGDSVRIGHASRVGHGTSIMFEPDPIGLMREMARKNVLVEITLTSNEQILGIKARHHPLRIYLEHDVPVALVTDDMGVARSSHTVEFVKAVEEHGVGYIALKRMVRNSIDHAFVDRDTKARLRRKLDAAFVAFER